jgi:thioredoxin reductase (NADPH)
LSESTSVVWDILIIGAGPAGLAAAVNVRVRGKTVLVMGSEAGSGRMSKAPEIKNYLGLEKISGADLAARFLSHARNMGTVVEQERVETIYPGTEFTVVTRSSKMYRSRTVVLATGISQEHLLPGEKDLLGHGLGYCATCDGALYRGRSVAVIGETPEAEEDVNFLAEICSRVFYFPRYNGEVKVEPKVEVRREKPVAVLGQEKVTGVSLPEGEVAVDGVFIIRKVAPVDLLLAGLESKDDAILVNRQMETNIPGVFAAGDCTGKPYQIGKAVGEGQTAGLAAVLYLDRLKV